MYFLNFSENTFLEPVEIEFCQKILMHDVNSAFLKRALDEMITSSKLLVFETKKIYFQNKFSLKIVASLKNY